MSPDIQNLEKLFSKNVKIIKKEITNFSEHGANFGSVMLNVNLRVSTNGTEMDLNMIAKTVPPNELTQKLFYTQTTFRTEIGFYTEIVPLLEQYQMPDCFPKYYGGRLNLNEDTQARVDSHGVILLENLKKLEYQNCEKTIGFDLNVSKSVVVNLATFHGILMVLKFLQPEMYQTRILPNVGEWKMDVSYHYDAKARISEILEQVPELVPLKQRILDGFDCKLRKPEEREAFSTLIHNDLWVNNIMVNLKNLKIKLVDFQLLLHGSLAKDLLFFLFSSVQIEVLKENYDQFLSLYYETLVKIMSKHKCQDRIFSFAEFEKELACEASWSQFGHLMYSLFPIFAPTDRPCAFGDLLHIDPSDLQLNKMIFIVKEFEKRKWI